MELKKEVESLLFSSGKMMKEKELAELTNNSEKEVREALEALKKEYDERDTSLVFMNSGDSWKLNVREKYIGLVTKIISDTELPFPVLETLGVIAFKAPAMQADIIKARGTNAYEQVGVLVESGFIEKKKEGRSFRLSLTPKFFEYFDVAGHEGIKEALKDVKTPEKVGELQVVDLPPEEQKKIDEKDQAEGNKQKLGALEVVDAIPEAEEKETIDTIRPDDDYLSSIDEKIKEMSKRNDELDQDDSFKRPTDLGADLSAEPGIEKVVTEGEEGEEEKAEAEGEEEKTDAEEGEDTEKGKVEEIEEGADEEGDEESDDSAESEEASDDKDKKDEF